MAENKTYIGAGDIIGLRVECKCGHVWEKQITDKGMPPLCLGCGEPWRSGLETEAEVSRNETLLGILFFALNRMSQGKTIYKWTIGITNPKPK